MLALTMQSGTFLWSGSDPDSLASLAKKRARTILCLDPSMPPDASKQKPTLNELNPCEICDSCVRFNTGHHVDFTDYTEILETEGYKITHFRQLRESLGHSGYSGNNRKVIYIPYLEELNPSCGNALLKMLEEPNENWFFVLTTLQEMRVLPTILSRCLISRLRPTKSDASLHPDLADALQDFFGSTKNPRALLDLFQENPELRPAILLKLKDTLIQYAEHQNKGSFALVRTLESLIDAEGLMKVNVNARSLLLDIVATWP